MTDIYILNKALAFYPGLFECIEDRLYFVDRNIDKAGYGISAQQTHRGRIGDVITLELICDSTNYTILQLVFHYFNKEEPPKGILFMRADLNLSDQSCIALYEHNIDIAYNAGNRTVYYDREAIIRKHTIQNIINP